MTASRSDSTVKAVSRRMKNATAIGAGATARPRVGVFYLLIKFLLFMVEQNEEILDDMSSTKFLRRGWD